MFSNLPSGVGSFDDNCDQIKQGRWIEFSDDFQNDSSVIYDGQYQNGKKVDRWDIFFLNFRGKKSFLIKEVYQAYVINFSGGGSFNKQEFPLKQGKWIEPPDVISTFFFNQHLLVTIKMGKKLLNGILCIGWIQVIDLN
ncbi:unnamed protein product [Paramecium octaurelia]|uniref:Uncharacterized protein n=1 Tax=Paramecium octaurelia TaxID=43137 RepID=A0A8S1YJU7_PAROT|nr:unnamed protein product [Paramecium octaurelia]